MEIQRESEHLLHSLDNLLERPFEHRAVYVSIYCMEYTFLFTMLVGNQRYHLVCEGTENLNIIQNTLNWLGNILLEKGILLITYTGFKYELLQLAQLLSAKEGDSIRGKYNVTLGGRFYIKTPWRLILKVNLFAVAEELFRTNCLLESKGCSPAFLAACLGENIDGALCEGNDLIRALYTFRLLLLKRFWEKGDTSKIWTQTRMQISNIFELDLYRIMHLSRSEISEQGKKVKLLLVLMIYCSLRDWI